MSENTAYTPGTAARWNTQALAGLRARLSGRWLTWGLLLGVTGLAFALNVWSLTDAGYGNTYYAAAVRSMTLSWKNFFFGAFDPGGFITVDKPPAFLWVGALSARIFGYSSLSILLPSAIAGAASVALLWLIVRKWFGLTAATIAGLVLALTPISVAVNKLNLPEPFMILALVGAAGCVMQSLESKRWWAWTAAAGFLVGVAFNTKMLGAWIPGPALALAIVVAARTVSKESAKQVAMRLVVLAAATFVVSGSWIAIVDAWPASDRPYVGGSTDNTELDLVLGYNGFGRVDGDAQGPGNGAPPIRGGQGGQFPPPNGGQFPNRGRFPGGPPRIDGIGNPGGNGQPGVGTGPGARGAGGIIAGDPGLLRMFDAANGGQIGWLLPFALAGAAIALWHWRRDPVRRAFAVLFLGWVLLYGGIFSFAQGIYHSYYTAALAPGIAALVGISAVALGNEVRRNARWLAAAAGLVAITVLVQLHIEGYTSDFYGWVRPLAVIGAIAGVVLLAFLALNKKPLAAGLALMVGAMLLLPGAWSISEATNTSLNVTLPQAGPRQGASGATFGSQAFDSGTADMAAWLNEHSTTERWQLVVNSAQNASTLIAEYQVSVMSLGGFSGHDNTLTVDQFANLVAAGDVRYVETSTRVGANGGNAVTLAVEKTCTKVTDSAIPSGFTIYDCSGKSNALHNAG